MISFIFIQTLINNMLNYCENISYIDFIIFKECIKYCIQRIRNNSKMLKKMFETYIGLKYVHFKTNFNKITT
jgi:hypothetical protein